MKNYLFSGIRPTGELHLGNYFGAIVNWIKLQKKKRFARSGIIILYS